MAVLVQDFELFTGLGIRSESDGLTTCFFVSLAL